MFYACLSILEQDENQNIEIEKNAWMQELGKRKIRATNIIQDKYSKTHTSLLCSRILFNESRI
jgi:hypothetical protein